MKEKDRCKMRKGEVRKRKGRAKAKNRECGRQQREYLCLCYKMSSVHKGADVEKIVEEVR
jgi:hypothetical protein